MSTQWAAPGQNQLAQTTRRIPAGFAKAAGLLLGALVYAAHCEPAQAQTLFGLITNDAPAPIEPTLPAVLPVPSANSLIEFYVGPTTTNQFAIDGASVAIDQERLVRYTLIVTSRSGARNVSYEAMRCDRREWQLLALARTDGSWSTLAQRTWRPISTGDSVNRHHHELFSKLCAGGAAAAQKPAGLLARLREPFKIDP